MNPLTKSKKALIDKTKVNPNDVDIAVESHKKVVVAAASGNFKEVRNQDSGTQNYKARGQLGGSDPFHISNLQSEMVSTQAPSLYGSTFGSDDKVLSTLQNSITKRSNKRGIEVRSEDWMRTTNQKIYEIRRKRLEQFLSPYI
ncbi:hypothetical protein FCM35_KLT02565 [Carex littledalei]|uniref:Uncharacterized protein n=1 Tax=Carex littledalei TaxID=544730 RepID=A0A833R411_9POAL|nr:hypothetical protein FCM35_KLT02565 [Carex littledalei]